MGYPLETNQDKEAQNQPIAVKYGDNSLFPYIMPGDSPNVLEKTES